MKAPYSVQVLNHAGGHSALGEMFQRGAFADDC